VTDVIDIGKQWHVNHVVDDYRIVTTWYRDVFGAVDIFTDEWLDAEKRWASMVAIADLAVDVMEPTAEGASLPLGKFLTRFGSHLHASAYFVNSPPADVYDALTAEGVRCFGLAGSGRDAMIAQPMSPVFTHPKDTAGQLEFMPYVEDKPGPLGVPGKWEDPRFLPRWSDQPWRDHPMSIGGWRVGVVVRELDRATAVYTALGATMLGRGDGGGFSTPSSAIGPTRRSSSSCRRRPVPSPRATSRLTAKSSTAVSSKPPIWPTPSPTSPTTPWRSPNVTTSGSSRILPPAMVRSSRLSRSADRYGWRLGSRHCGTEPAVPRPL
jgi:hypothetical protein